MNSKNQRQQTQYSPYSMQGHQPTTSVPYGFYAPSGSQIGTAAPVQGVSAGQYVPGMLPLEESYIENILRLNKGKHATVYMTFENNQQWNAKIFKGIIEAAGRDHIILSDPKTGKRYLLLMVYLDYITFDEEINYVYPPGLATYSPR
ncbi:spore coat protein GerQ [Bacillus alveayuensis]|jgi:spore germination protein Q|uniref:Spore germination protein Q n=1 Tax=Aeribacillus alveayuensis TaxID=279215 RepID=A0ABT9VP42_9BACI|nr:spore coat protein GerQ [Bacillus alveayuensis]MDQ0162664.1 spore germination protein Q [Bacillus alveayuensis]